LYNLVAFVVGTLEPKTIVPCLVSGEIVIQRSLAHLKINPTLWDKYCIWWW